MYTFCHNGVRIRATWGRFGLIKKRFNIKTITVLFTVEYDDDDDDDDDSDDAILYAYKKIGAAGSVETGDMSVKLVSFMLVYMMSSPWYSKPAE